ncbi:MAG: hypothetical protein KBE65_23765 [Phycisphaerae bacterium]|nr:hypothetical protein [Phycisphaerae bacterium]
MTSFEWFSWSVPGRTHLPGRRAILRAGIGLCICAGLLVLHHNIMALLVLLLTGGFSILSYCWPQGSAALERFLQTLGHLAGRLAATFLLTPILVFVLPVVRIWKRATGIDTLHLRDSDRHTFWLECDSNIRKHRYISSMFAPERRVVRSPRKLAYAGACIVLFLLAEGSLRLLGLGNPILYVDDPVIGYYTGPNQSVQRYSNTLVETNRFGMRAPDYSEVKRDGHFRILMLGDSTLWGGSYVGQDEIYARLLEKRLAAQFPEAGLEVWNMGVNGWGPCHKLGYIERFGTFDADLAIVCLPIGDVTRPLSRLRQVPYFSVTRPPRLALEEVFVKLIWRYQTRLIGALPEDILSVQVKHGVDAYVQLGRHLRDAGCEVLFEVLPSRAAGTSATVPEQERAWVEGLAAALAADSFHVGFPAGFAADQPSNAIVDLYHDECHLHWRGHQVYAAYLANVVSGQSKAFVAWSKSGLVMVVTSGGGL